MKSRAIAFLLLVPLSFALTACSDQAGAQTGESVVASGAAETKTPSLSDTGLSKEEEPASSLGEQGKEAENSTPEPEGASEIDYDVAPVPEDRWIAASDLQDLLSAGSVTVVDIRTYADYQGGSIPGEPKSIPLKYLKSRIGEISSGASICFVAFDEKDAAAAYAILLEQGYKAEDLHFLEGGIESWEQAGYTLQPYFNTCC